MLRRNILAGALAMAAGGVGAARAAIAEVAIARQPSLGHLPLMIMEERGLLEKHAAARGLRDLKVRYVTLAGGAAMNDALLSGSIHFAAGGVPPLILLWSKTEGTRLAVKGVAAMNTMPLLMNTNNPAIRSLKDFTDRDKIALPRGEGLGPGDVSANGRGERARAGPPDRSRPADGDAVPPGRHGGASVGWRDHRPFHGSPGAGTRVAQTWVSARFSTPSTCWASPRRSTSFGPRRPSSPPIPNSIRRSPPLSKRRWPRSQRGPDGRRAGLSSVWPKTRATCGADRDDPERSQRSPSPRCRAQSTSIRPSWPART